MNYKAICSDIDGTLLDKNRELSVRTIAEVSRIKELIPFILISSRMPKSMRLLQKQLGVIEQPIIAYNGSLVLKGDDVLNSIEIPHSLLLTIQSYCKETSIHLSIYHNDDWFVPEMDYWAKREERNTKISPNVLSFFEVSRRLKLENKGCHKIMCMGEESEIGVLYEKLKQFHANEINAYRSKPTYIEITDINQDKGSSLNVLINKLFPSLTMQDFIAFGDNYNDTSLLAGVGLGIAVKNAKEEVLNVADEITESNIEDGVAISIKKYFTKA